MYAKIHIYPDFYTPYWVLINMFSRNSGGGGGVDVGGVDGGCLLYTSPSPRD